MKHLCLLISSVFFIGFIPGAPGTYASVATTLVFYLIYRLSHPTLTWLHLGVVCLIAVVGASAADKVSRSYAKKDPRFVVIDEVAGQLLTFLFLPITLLNLILGTVLFRTFDILKPFPIRRLESLRGGAGIMADDLMAGLYSSLALQLLNWLLKNNHISH